MGQQPLPEAKKVSAVTRRVLLIVGLVALAIRGGALVDLHLHDPYFNYPVVDELTNVEMAREVLEDGASAPAPFWKPPLFGYLLALIAATFGGIGEPGLGVSPLFAITVKGMLAILDSITAILIARIAGRSFREPGALVAGLLYACAFLPVYYCGQFLDTTLFTFLTVLTADRAQAAERQGNLDLWAWTGVVLGLACLTRPPMLVAIPILGLLAFNTIGESKVRLLRAIAICGAAVITIMPVTLLNSRHGDDFALVSTNGGINFFIGNRQGGEIGSDGLTSVHAGPRWRELLELTSDLEKPSERSRAYYQLAVDEIRKDPGAWGIRLAVKSHALIQAFDAPNNKNFDHERSRSRALWILHHFIGSSGILIPLLATTLILGGFSASRARPLLWILISQLAVTVAFFVAARYRVPLIALACPLAGSLPWMLNDKQRRLRGLALLIPLLILSHLDLAGHRQRLENYSIDPLALGWVHEQRGDHQLARAWYERALSQDADYPEAHHNLGHLDREEGNIEGARERFEAAIAIDDEFAPGYNSLGSLLIEEEPREALRCFQRAVEIDPNYAGAHSNLGQLLESAQQLLDALDHYLRARAVAPEQPLHSLLAARLLWRMHRGSQALGVMKSIDTDRLDGDEGRLYQEMIETLEEHPDGPPPTQPGEDPFFDPTRPEAQGIEG